MAETASLREIPALSGVRGLAALWVLTHHAWMLGGPVPIAFDVARARIDFMMIVIMGWKGVDIFFVLSAFLLTPAFAGARPGLVPPPSLPNHFRRRPCAFCRPTTRSPVRAGRNCYWSAMQRAGYDKNVLAVGCARRFG